jgi:hypothetical protein
LPLKEKRFSQRRLYVNPYKHFRKPRAFVTLLGLTLSENQTAILSPKKIVLNTLATKLIYLNRQGLGYCAQYSLAKVESSHNLSP